MSPAPSSSAAAPSPTRDLALDLGADLWAGPIDEVIALFVSLAGGPPPRGTSDSTEAAE